MASNAAVFEQDVLVVGGGMAGLAAAVRLKDRGLTPLVLEKAHRVGGRMTSDRVNGFVVDTGVTLLGRRFRGMRRLARRSGVPLVPVNFSLAIQGDGCVRGYRARRLRDVLSDERLSPAAKRAFVRIVADIVAGHRGMLHGNSHRATRLDRETVGEYLARLGRGGQDLFDALFEPGLRAALGGAPADASRLAFMQVVWNTLGAGFWNVDGGVDRIPEALALEVESRRGADVREVRVVPGGVEADVRVDGSDRVVRARAAILAIPGHLIPSILPSAPGWMREPASRTTFSTLSSAHVALSRIPASPHVGYGFSAGAETGIGVLELEHLRAPGRCPEGKGMVSVYFVNSPGFQCAEADDDVLRRKACGVVERTFPESEGSVEFVHVIRWPTAIALFPAGRLSEVVRLEKQLADWTAPIDLAGDWMDGVSSESAVQTGFRAADRMARRLSA